MPDVDASSNIDIVPGDRNFDIQPSIVSLRRYSRWTPQRRTEGPAERVSTNTQELGCTVVGASGFEPPTLGPEPSARLP
jgi:hypothetical protein